MITISINGTKHKIPTSFNDITPRELHKLPDTKPKTLIAHFTDISQDIIEKMTADQIIQIQTLLNFIEDQPHNLQIKEEISVQSKEWIKLEMTKQALETKNEPFIAVEVSRRYFGDQVFDWPFSLIYGQTAQILHSLSLFLERYKELNDSDPYDDDQLEAGVKGLESFGVGAIRYALSKGDVTKYEQVENMSAEAVYFTLLYEKAQSEYSKRLKQIYDRQNGIGTRKGS